MSDNTAQNMEQEAPKETMSAAELQQGIMEGYHELEERYVSTKEQVYDLNRKAVDFIQKHPGACIVGGIAVGFLIGRMAKKRWLI